jgi:diaminohydroxyphosphoribosylaminopyrimidine deaminase/5-amino-6-(5-phosphoribosylamino)uracil reductase
MVGYKTALMDNPRLNVRHWTGTNPVRIVIDKRLQLPKHLHLLDNSQSTIVVNFDHETEIPTDPERHALPSTAYLKIDQQRDEITQLLEGLHGRKIHSVLVEGGAAVINAFLESGLWDEIRRCQGKLTIGEGVNAPVPGGVFRGSEQIGDDLWTFYSRI